MSRLYSRVIQKIFDFSPIITKRSQEQKKLELEYEKLSHLSPHKVESEKQFSLKLEFNWYTEKTHKWYQSNLRRKAQAHIKNYSSLGLDIGEKVSEKILRGPISLSSTIEIGKNALSYFSNISEKNLLNAVLNVCKVTKTERSLFQNKRKRKKFLRERRNRRARCTKILLKRQEYFFKHLTNFKEFDLSKFKKFLGYYYSKSSGLDNLYDLFGEENLFIHGSLSAKTKAGRNFHTFFKAGEFSGLGVIDNFKNEKIEISE